MSYTKLPHNHHNETDHTALLEQLDDIQHFQIVSELFKQLSDPTRIRLFWLLCHCEECVLNLSAMMKMTSPAISQTPASFAASLKPRRLSIPVYSDS